MSLVALKQQRLALLTYMKAKMEAEDWHAVSDAANDIRVLEKEIEATRYYTEFNKQPEVAKEQQRSGTVRADRSFLHPLAKTEEPNECGGSRTDDGQGKGETR